MKINRTLEPKSQDLNGESKGKNERKAKQNKQHKQK